MKIVERHHDALKHWAELRRQLRFAPALVTFDYHTDTSKPFRSFLTRTGIRDPLLAEGERASLLKSLHFKSPESVDEAIKLLAHDEHIITAIKADIISSAFVIAQNARDTDLATYQEHKVACFAALRSPLLSEGARREQSDMVFDSEIVDLAVQHFNGILQAAGDSELLQQPYILDIDLDVINTHQALHPVRQSSIKQLAKNALLITIATEDECTRALALDPELDAKTILPKLVTLLT